MRKQRKTILLIAGSLSLGLSLLHLVMIFIGAPAYDYFRAGPEMVEWAKAGSPIPAMVTGGVALVLLFFALYGFSGAGLIAPLRFQKWALPIIGIIFTLRGLAIFLQIPGYLPENELRDIIFSLVALITGLLYLTGHWRKGSA